MFENTGTPSGTHDVDLKTSSGTPGKATTGKKRGAAGVPSRKDSKGQESVIEISELKKRAKELESLYKKKQDAAEAYNLGVKAVAEASGLMSNVVSKFVKARADAKFAAKQREYLQLSLVFEELGE
jgi:hypothetical protein